MLSLLPESWLQFTSGLSLPQNQSLWTLEWVWTKILEDFRRCQLRGGDDGNSGYGMQRSRRGRGRGFGGAGRGAKKDDDSNDEQGGTGWGTVRNLDVGASRKNGANMVADSSDHNPKSNGGAEKKKERTAGQFFHIGEQGEQGDASSKVGAELHSLDYWVLDTGAAWTMTPRKELLDNVRAAPINEVCSASGHALKVAGAGRAAFKGADGKPVVLHDVLLVPDLKANLISLRKLAKAGVSTSTDGARTYKGQLGNRVDVPLDEVDDPVELETDKEMYGGWKKQPEIKVSQQMEQITMQLDLTPSVWEEGEEAAAEVGEFLGAETTAWLKKQGIQRELTTAYTPQSNGVAERANRTILETARALLIESGVGDSMWPHAVRHATVARNRVLTKVGNESWVPLERWLGRKPPVDMLRVFGCMAVAHVPKKYRSKLWASAIWCMAVALIPLMRTQRQ
ncbi:unnamed protein product [Closterium sp. NIES-54]